MRCLQGRVKFPIGGTVRARDTHDLVQFQNRLYSLDERRENVNKNGGAGKLPDTLPRMMDMADIYRYGKRERKVIENGCKKIFTIINIMKDIIK